jgi:heterotetrameric sarcosine oxidase gamma subunit
MSDVGVALAPLRSIAGIGAFRDQSGLFEALRGEFWMPVPEAIGFVENGQMRLCRLGPSRYVMSGDRQADLPGRLGRVLDGLAAVTDQSDLWKTFVFTGVDVRDVLSRVVPVDLHAAKFAVGGLALTRAGHLDVRLFRTGEMAFEVSVARSFGEDLAYLLSAAASG